MKKKHDGNLGDLLATATCLLVLLMVFITSVHFIKIMECKRYVNNYARDYLLILEEEGTLTNAQVGNLKKQIADMGFSESNITVVFNENNTKVGYGKEVSLEISVTADWQELGLSKVYDFIGDNYVFSTKLYSTSKS